MRQVEEAAFAAFLNRTLEEHAHFVIRNVTPRSVFANLLALMWLVCAGKLVQWVTKMRRCSSVRGRGRRVTRRRGAV